MVITITLINKFLVEKINFNAYLQYNLQFQLKLSHVCFVFFVSLITLLRSFYELPNYKSIHQVRNYSKGGRVLIYINKSLNFKLRPD